VFGQRAFGVYGARVVVDGKNDYAVEEVGVIVDEGFGYVEVMVGAGVVVDGGFGRGCTASLQTSLALC
jgi:hypothetical protein